MQAGKSSPNPSKFDYEKSGLNSSNGGSQSLGRSTSQARLRAPAVTGLFRPTSPTSPRSPTLSSSSAAPKLDLPTLSGLTSADASFGQGASVTDEFGALMFGDEILPVTILSDNETSNRKLSPRDAITLIETTSAVIHAQGMHSTYIQRSTLF